MVRILITGGGGFIGSSLVDHFLRSQVYEIVVIDNFSTGKRDNLASHKNLEVHTGSITDDKLVRKVFENFRPEIVIHAAASYKDPSDWIGDVQTNLEGTVNIVNQSIKVNVKRLIFLQTALCYGLNPMESPISVTHPLLFGKSGGGSSYAITKTAAELFIQLSGIEYISFRLANVYGPRNLSGPLPAFYNAISNKRCCIVTNTRRDFIFIDDLVACVAKAVKVKNIRRNIYHIGSNIDYSITALFNLVANYLKVKDAEVLFQDKLNIDDTYTILLNNQETCEDFDWRPLTKLEVGVQITIDWYKSKAFFETYTHLKNL